MVSSLKPKLLISTLFDQKLFIVFLAMLLTFFHLNSCGENTLYTIQYFNLLEFDSYHYRWTICVNTITRIIHFPHNCWMCCSVKVIDKVADVICLVIFQTRCSINQEDSGVKISNCNCDITASLVIWHQNVYDCTCP